MAKKLKKYSVSIPWYASVIVEVEATSKKEAKELALEEAHPGLCHQCTHGIDMDGGPSDDHEPDVIELT